MARILVLLVLVVTVNGFAYRNKFSKLEETDLIKKVQCGDHEEKRNEVINKSRCGEPKEVFVDLKPQSSYMQVVPSRVWVKRCVGLCDEGPVGSQCMPLKVKMESIPVRILNLKGKESCATYDVEVHESCGCGCEVPTKECPLPKVFNTPEPGYEVESL